MYQGPWIWRGLGRAGNEIIPLLPPSGLRRRAESCAQSCAAKASSSGCVLADSSVTDQKLNYTRPKKKKRNKQLFVCFAKCIEVVQILQFLPEKNCEKTLPAPVLYLLGRLGL